MITTPEIFANNLIKRGIKIYRPTIDHILDTELENMSSKKDEKCRFSSKESKECSFKQLSATACFDCPLNYTFI
jgi:hypothetical protein